MFISPRLFLRQGSFSILTIFIMDFPRAMKSRRQLRRERSPRRHLTEENLATL
jgi:hypothetical protein